MRIEQTACASALECLVGYIESHFKKKVAAATLRFSLTLALTLAWP